MSSTVWRQSGWKSSRGFREEEKKYKKLRENSIVNDFLTSKSNNCGAFVCGGRGNSFWIRPVTSAVTFVNIAINCDKLNLSLCGCNCCEIDGCALAYAINSISIQCIKRNQWTNKYETQFLLPIVQTIYSICSAIKLKTEPEQVKWTCADEESRRRPLFRLLIC